MLQLTLSCAVREWFVVAQPSSNTEGFPARTSCPEPRTPSGELLEPRQIRPLMATNTKHLGLFDQLAESVQNGTWNPPMASQEPLASRGASTEASAEVTVEFADQNNMQVPDPDQQLLAHTENQQLLDNQVTEEKKMGEPLIGRTEGKLVLTSYTTWHGICQLEGGCHDLRPSVWTTTH